MEATITYSGLPREDVISASYTLSHGVSPGIVNIEAVLRDPSNPNVQREGSVVISWSGTSILLRGCVVDRIDISVDGSGRERMSLTILDRRHAWRDNGVIEGEFNVRFSTASGYRSNERSLRELATLCLDAMGERRYDVSRMPNDLYPQVFWELTNPSLGLSELCDMAGCRPVFNPFLDRMEIWPAGVGRELPVNGLAISGKKTFDPPELPDQLTYLADYSEFQADLQLVPSAIDTDGLIKPIWKVSYLKGLIRNHPESRYWWEFNTADIWEWQKVPAQHRHLAKATALRMYQISPFVRLRPTFSEDKDPPVAKLRFSDVDNNAPIESIDRILPLLEHQLVPRVIEQNEAPSGVKFLAQALQPQVWGFFSPGYDTLLSPIETAHRVRGDAAREENARGFFRLSNVNDDNPSIFHLGPYDISYDDGTVTFPSPVFTYMKKDILRLRKVSIRSADLVLRCAFRVRDKKSRAFHRAFVNRKLRRQVRPGRIKYINNDQGKLLTIVDLTGKEAHLSKTPRDELRLQRRKAEREKISNLEDVEEVGNRYINAELRRLRNEEPITIQYVGFQPLFPDGARSQIRWSLTPDGRGETQATFNDEMDDMDVTYIQRRWNERVQAIIDQEANTKKARQERRENKGKVVN